MPDSLNHTQIAEIMLRKESIIMLNLTNQSTRRKYINNHWHGTAQAKAVIFFILVAAFGALQLYATREKKEKKSKSKEKRS